MSYKINASIVDENKDSFIAKYNKSQKKEKVSFRLQKMTKLLYIINTLNINP